jgi:hypothetical protein
MEQNNSLLALLKQQQDLILSYAKSNSEYQVQIAQLQKENEEYKERLSNHKRKFTEEEKEEKEEKDSDITDSSSSVHKKQKLDNDEFVAVHSIHSEKSNDDDIYDNFKVIKERLLQFPTHNKCIDFFDFLYKRNLITQSMFTNALAILQKSTNDIYNLRICSIILQYMIYNHEIIYEPQNTPRFLQKLFKMKNRQIHSRNIRILQPYVKLTPNLLMAKSFDYAIHFINENNNLFPDTETNHAIYKQHIQTSMNMMNTVLWFDGNTFTLYNKIKRIQKQTKSNSNSNTQYVRAHECIQSPSTSNLEELKQELPNIDLRKRYRRVEYYRNDFIIAAIIHVLYVYRSISTDNPSRYLGIEFTIEGFYSIIQAICNKYDIKYSGMKSEYNYIQKFYIRIMKTCNTKECSTDMRWE